MTSFADVQPISPKQSTVRAVSFGVLVVVVVAVFALPQLSDNNYTLAVGAELFLAVTLAVSLWPLLVAGQLNLAHVALMAVGAYTTAALGIHAEWDWWATVPAAAVTAALAGLVLGYVTLRLRGPYFFLVTFAFLEATRLFFGGYFTDTFGGASGLVGVPRLPELSLGPLSIPLSRPEGRFYLGAVLMIVSVAVVHRLMASHTGVVLRALGESDSLAGSVGVDALRYRVATMVITAGIAGLAGSYFAYSTLVVHPSDFALSRGVLVVVYVVIGGTGTVWGPVAGAALITVLGEWLRALETLRLLGYGALLIVVMLFVPGGLTSLVGRARTVLARTGMLGSPRGQSGWPTS